MKVLGVTGGIGAGKSTVSGIFAELGAAVIDADHISHLVMEPGGCAYMPVLKAFGGDILTPGHTIDRKALAAVVFGDDQKLRLLNEITHACIFREMEQRLRRAETELVCLDVPLLFSCDFPIRCDGTVAVLAPRELRIRRVMVRDGCTREQVEARMAKQLTDAELRELADFCILNDNGEEKVRQQAADVYQKMME